MSYYNSAIAIWEPVIELVEQPINNKQVVNATNYQPWQLKLQVIFKMLSDRLI